ncbi:hypothetical protein QBC37DRAFT_377958 [Rhypophila decipiens]|uniref:DUF726-domain-containing protein n=1 Tax=Rhypophila decipiens TaxID=261697 RepID=A0AAN6XZI5_9PEZI|nr:hypothetical protein QBC37DRAFT_377958 [Rhypophila decipiens]
MAGTTERLAMADTLKDVDPQDGASATDPPGIKVPASPVGSSSPTSQQSPSDEHSSEMAPGGRQRPITPKREADFSSLLTAGEKTELLSLINKVNDHLQKQITQVFDSTCVEETTKPARVNFWSGLPSRLRDLNIIKPHAQCPRNGNNGRSIAPQKENLNPSLQSAPSSDNQASDQAPDGSAGQAADTLPPRLQELKKEALAHFKKWQAAVNKRVADISVKKTGDAQNAQNPGPGTRRGAQAKPPFNRGNRANAAPKTSLTEHDFSLSKHYTPIPTSLSSLPLEKKTLLLHALLLLFLSLENYTAYTRLLLLHIASSLHLPLRALAEDEVRVAKSLSQIAKDVPADEVMQKKAEEGKSSKKWKIGLASIAGAAVIGIAGGLAAPLVAAGIGSVLGGIGLGGSATASLLGAMAESGLIVGALFGIYGARATGKAMEQYTKDIDDFAFIPLRGSIGQDLEIGKIEPDCRRLRVVIGISGWLDEANDVTNPWRMLGEQNEVYGLKWEADSLLKMGTAMETVLRSAAWPTARKEITTQTIHESLRNAIWPLGLLKISKIIDNAWSVVMVRADKAGAILADIIMNKVQGERGVTLIGYSIGARVIYACLMCLAERRAFGLVENAVLMGTPAPSGAHVWCAMKSVVSGRLVNVYSENDCILGFLYRTSSIQYGVAGLERIDGIDGIENVDVSAKISSHMRYRYLVGSILRHIGWEDIDGPQVSVDEETLFGMEEKSRERERRRNAIDNAAEKKELEEEAKRGKKKEQEPIRTRLRKNKRR